MTDTTRRTALGLLALLAAAPLWAAQSAGSAPAPRLSAVARRRIDRLVAAMTPEELAGQLGAEGAWSPRIALSDFFSINPFMPPVSPETGAQRHQAQLQRVRRGQVGMLMGTLDLDTVQLAQATAVQESRLKIPLIFAVDVIHGHRICFPIPLGEAASWEPDLARRTARAAAVEATRFGIDMSFAPMVDIGRDQRWGRVAEGAGEDVLLGRRFAAARVQGFQNSNLQGADTLLACPKHFAGYGAAESGLDYAGADLPERVLREVHLPPFQAACDAGALATMAAFNTVDGVPASGSRRLLTDILRGEFGFAGLVISDFNSIHELVLHGTASDEADAARQALLAGCDMAMLGGIYLQHLPALMAGGHVPRQAVAQAVRRVLAVKEAAGLFDDPFRRISPARYADTSTDAAHRALAREAGRRSVVLLKNEGGVLPLAPGLRRIALIGPFAEDKDHVNGPWGPIHVRVEPVSLAEGLRAALPAGTALRVVAGAGIDQPLPGGEAAAREAADWAELVVLAVGEGQDMSGEGHSRAQIVLPAPQQALAEAVARAGRPLVVVLRNGRALALHGAVRDAAAILVGWFLGTETGHALADVLTGAHGPSGRLPVSFPLDSGQQPYHYARAPGGRPAPADKPLAKFSMHFDGLPDAPLYPFGHGLSYARVAYGPTQVDSPRLAGDGRLVVSAALRNTGDRPCDEVVQLYVRDRVASVSRPVRELKDFQKITLAPGEARSVRFTLTRDDLQFVGSDLRWRAEPGDFDVWVAPSATTGTPARFRLLA